MSAFERERDSVCMRVCEREMFGVQEVRVQDIGFGSWSWRLVCLDGGGLMCESQGWRLLDAAVERGTYTTGRTGFWPRRSGKCPSTFFFVIPEN